MGFALHTRLKGSRCAVKMTEMRLRVAAVGALFYSDVLVHCKPTPDPAATLELTGARRVMEVLSPSTERFDRGDKLAACMRLPGLRQLRCCCPAPKLPHGPATACRPTRSGLRWRPGRAVTLCLWRAWA